jgi:hypothetical protein
MQPWQRDPLGIEKQEPAEGSKSAVERLVMAPGTRIRFLVTLEEGPDEYAPSKHFCKRGDTGEVLGLAGDDRCYRVKTDGWPAPFIAYRSEFEELVP